MAARLATVTAAAVLSAFGVIWSHQLAMDTTVVYDAAFVVFWLAFASGMVPLWWVATSGQHDRWAFPAVVIAAVVTTWPKVLRTWSGPLFSDEFGHLYQTRRVLTDGLFPVGDNPLLKVAPEFPLLHWMTAGFTRLGLDIWVAASVVASLAHVATAVGVFALVNVTLRRRRAAAVGALFYMLQPGWLFFSAQFAYETLALPLLIATVTIALWARTVTAPHRHVALCGVVVGSTLTALAHHFASVVLVVMLLGLLAAGATSEEKRLWVSRGDVVATVVSVIVVAAWLTSRGVALFDYYAPTVDSLVQRVRSDSTGTRAAFSGSAVPTFERWAGFLFPFMVLGLYLRAVAVTWTSWRAWPVEKVFTVLGGSFFVSLPLVFTTAGSEASHRWWAYAYVGLAVTIASAWAQPISWPWMRAIPSKVRTGAVVAAVVVAAVGGGAAGTTVGYRFPGPEEIGNDARSVSAPAREMADVLFDRFGPASSSGIGVLTDRYTAQQLVGYGMQRTTRPSVGYPAWNLLFSTDPDALRDIAAMLRHDNIAVVVVDIRMATDRPVLGYWFNRTEPDAHSDLLVPGLAVTKFDCADWSTPLHRVGHLAAYNIDVDMLARTGDVCS